MSARWRTLLGNARARTQLVAVVNASPESFFAGSVVTDPAAIADRAAQAEAEGAAALDIGARSTAPYRDTAITIGEEVRRIASAVKAARAATALPISADTMHAEAARAALDEGADAINDVSALADPAMAPLVRERACGLVLMANDDPALDEAGRTPAEVTVALLRAALARAEGIDPALVAVDPGIGFFRHRSMPWWQWDLAVLAALDDIRGALARPLYVGVSRKSFIGHLTGQKDPAGRLAGTLGAHVALARRGVELLRVHDVRATREALLVAGRIG